MVLGFENEGRTGIAPKLLGATALVAEGSMEIGGHAFTLYDTPASRTLEEILNLKLEGRRYEEARGVGAGLGSGFWFEM